MKILFDEIRGIIKNIFLVSAEIINLETILLSLMQSLRATRRALLSRL